MRRDWRHTTFEFELEGKPHAELDLPVGSRSLGDGSKLWRVHKPVWDAEVCVIERIEKFPAELEVHAFGEDEVSVQCQIHCLHPGTLYRISSGISECECGRHGERGRIHPLTRSARAGPEHRFASDVGPYRILAEYRARICRVAEN